MELAHPNADLCPWAAAACFCARSLFHHYSLAFGPLACVRDTPLLGRPHHSIALPTADWLRRSCRTADIAYPVFAADRVMVSCRFVTERDDSVFCDRPACPLLPFAFTRDVNMTADGSDPELVEQTQTNARTPIAAATLHRSQSRAIDEAWPSARRCLAGR